MKVLYIGGAGRSGSTILDMILGNVPGFVSIGEARYFWEYLTNPDIACGCGTSFNICSLWSNVISRLESLGVDSSRMAMLSKRLDRTRNLPRISRNGFFGAQQEWMELASATHLLYRLVAETSTDQVLVDASKVPSHLALLGSITAIDLRILHLVRDGRAVAYSWSKRQKRELAIQNRKAYMPRRSASRAMLTWMVENISLLKMSCGVRSVIMRYEDFAQDPFIELVRALENLGFQGSELGFLQKPTLSLSATHSVGGNPLRFSRGEISIAVDNEWKAKMSTASKIAFGLLALPLLMRFGYQL